jgi:hypothetical protein
VSRRISNGNRKQKFEDKEAWKEAVSLYSPLSNLESPTLKDSKGISSSLISVKEASQAPFTQPAINGSSQT